MSQIFKIGGLSGFWPLVFYKFNRTQIGADSRRKKDAMRIAVSTKRLSVYIRVHKRNSYTIELG